ncbi:MAG: hydratase, partial [Planctomycetes bacterium]|nr:hydratase [Planctomycetota bacterium]
SHTRYGALGTMGIGEGGGEMAKQLLGRTYDLARPKAVGVYMTGKPNKGVGPHDVALSIVGAVYKNGYVNNKVMEFIGDGIHSLPVEYRNAIDVMTTETTCLSSIWKTDDKVKEYFEIHGRPEAYKTLDAGEVAYYSGMVHVDLSKIEPTIALPFHPSNTYTIREFRANAREILAETQDACMKQLNNKNLNMRLTDKARGGEIYVDQGIVVGCAGGTFDSICGVADILEGKTIGNASFTLSVYPGSQPAFMELVRNGAIAKLIAAGAVVRSAFCGPCFGSGDTPANGELSIRHATRNFPNREGSKPTEGQISSVALMDALSIAATAANGGKITSAADIDVNFTKPKYYFDKSIYEGRVYNGTGKPDPSVELQFGPNIRDWPKIPSLTDHLLLKVVSYITDPVTTTDELIPSGETASYRSNPMRLAEFALFRKDPEYVGRAKAVQAVEKLRGEGGDPCKNSEVAAAWKSVHSIEEFKDIAPKSVGVGSAIYAHRPGDGSAREQAVSVQRVLGGWANICIEYATKRYRSNLINWGMLPFQIEDASSFENGSWIFVPNAKKMALEGLTETEAWVLGIFGENPKKITLKMAALTDEEKKITAAGCLINYYAMGKGL